MPRLAVIFDADWQPKKCQVVSLEIRRFLVRSGGVTNVSDIGPIDGTLPAKRYLVLGCNNNAFGKGRCGAEWEADKFTECPKCHQRRYVYKVEARTEEPAPQPEPGTHQDVPVEDHPEETANPAA